VWVPFPVQQMRPTAQQRGHHPPLCNFYLVGQVPRYLSPPLPSPLSSPSPTLLSAFQQSAILSTATTLLAKFHCSHRCLWIGGKGCVLDLLLLPGCLATKTTEIACQISVAFGHLIKVSIFVAILLLVAEGLVISRLGLIDSHCLPFICCRSIGLFGASVQMISM
jgi:hypothetical protein